MIVGLVEEFLEIEVEQECPTEEVPKVILHWVVAKGHVANAKAA